MGLYISILRWNTRKSRLYIETKFIMMTDTKIPRPTDASIILTYRCPMRCQMCNIWQNPTKKSEEIKASDLKSLPQLKFINLTGGEHHPDVSVSDALPNV